MRSGGLLQSKLEELGITTPGQATLIAGHDEPLIARGAKTELTQAGDLFASGYLHGYLNILAIIPEIVNNLEIELA